MALVVAPIQCYPGVSFACPIACKFVVFFECILEMLCMFFANIFDAEIIDDQCELYGSCVVLPKSRYQFALPVSVFVEVFFKEFVGQESCMREAVHSMLGSDVDASVLVAFSLSLYSLMTSLGISLILIRMNLAHRRGVMR